MRFPLLEYIRSFFAGKSLQDETLFSTKSFEVSLEAFTQKEGGESCVFKTLTVFSSYDGNLEPSTHSQE